MVENFKKLHAMEPDYENGMEMQQRISDFILTHDLSNQVQLQCVICKQDLCEIRAFQDSNKVFSQILSSLGAQPWWTSFLKKNFFLCKSQPLYDGALRTSPVCEGLVS